VPDLVMPCGESDLALPLELGVDLPEKGFLGGLVA
jgi:hypothetical protein